MDNECKEAEKIYQAIFKKKIPLDVKENFLKASKIVESRYNQQELVEYNRYVREVSDLVALEMASRYLKRLPLLTQKIHMMISLAETIPENYPVFINNKDRYLYGLGAIIFSVIHSIFKLLKGIILLKVY